MGLSVTTVPAPRKHLPTGRFARRTALSVPAVAMLLALLSSGCQKPLFAPTDEQSPYDRYDAIRAQRATPYVEDEFGSKKPNLRGRLLDNE